MAALSADQGQRGAETLARGSLDTAGDEPFFFQTCGLFIADAWDLALAMWQFKDRNSRSNYKLVT
jgi:hypothetical protein